MDADVRPPVAGQDGLQKNRLAKTLRRPVECWLLSACLLVAGFVCALEGQALVAILCVSVAVPAYVWGYAWAPVFGRQAYYRRVTRVWNDWASARLLSETRWQALARERIPQLTALEPPDHLREPHRELLSWVGGEEAISVEASPEAARKAVPRLGRRAKLRVELAGFGFPPERPLGPAEQSYSKAIAELFETSDRDYARVAEEGQLSLEGAIRKLRRMRRPDAVADEHDLLIDALKEYAAAQRAFSEAALAADGARLLQSAERLDVAGEQLDAWRARTTAAVLR